MTNTITDDMALIYTCFTNQWDRIDRRDSLVLAGAQGTIFQYSQRIIGFQGSVPLENGVIDMSFTQVTRIPRGKETLGGSYVPIKTLSDTSYQGRIIVGNSVLWEGSGKQGFEKLEAIFAEEPERFVSRKQPRAPIEWDQDENWRLRK